MECLELRGGNLEPTTLGWSAVNEPLLTSIVPFCRIQSAHRSWRGSGCNALSPGTAPKKGIIDNRQLNPDLG